MRYNKKDIYLFLFLISCYIVVFCFGPFGRMFFSENKTNEEPKVVKAYPENMWKKAIVPKQDLVPVKMDLSYSGKKITIDPNSTVMIYLDHETDLLTIEVKSINKSEKAPVQIPKSNSEIENEEATNLLLFLNSTLN